MNSLSDEQICDLVIAIEVGGYSERALAKEFRISKCTVMRYSRIMAREPSAWKQACDVSLDRCDDNGKRTGDAPIFEKKVADIIREAGARCGATSRKCAQCGEFGKCGHYKGGDPLLGDVEVERIRVVYSSGFGTYGELAEMVGVHRAAIRDILRYKTHWPP